MIARRRLLAVLSVGALAAGLAACGRKGRLEEPVGTVYPRTYPYTPMPGESAAARAARERARARDAAPGSRDDSEEPNR